MRFSPELVKVSTADDGFAGDAASATILECSCRCVQPVQSWPALGIG